jgi:hypothetical protein
MLQYATSAKFFVGYALSLVLDIPLGVDAVCLMLVLVLFLFLSDAPYRLAFTAFRPTSQDLIKRRGRHLSVPTNQMNIFS